MQAEAIDATAFPALAGLYQVRGVPRTVFNGRVPVDGAMPEPHFLKGLLAATEA